MTIDGEKKSLWRRRATPQSLASKLSPLNPANVVATGAGELTGALPDLVERQRETFTLGRFVPVPMARDPSLTLRC